MAEEIEGEKESQEADEDELTSALEGKQKDESNEDDSKDEDSKEDKEDEAEKAGDDEAGEAEKETEEKEEKESKLDPVKVLQAEIKALRQMVRTSKREQSITQAKLERLGEKKVKPKDEDDEDDEDDVKEKEKREESLSTIEELQKSISSIGASKGAALDVLLEAMEQNAKYEDIREVCSRENFDDIFEVIATDATKDGGNFDETLLKVELSIWSKANPYKYMYEIIKKYHPSYAAKGGAAGPGDKKEGKTPVKANAPGTIADKGGDSNIKSGWTAKRIDDLPEDELHTVPREIYDRYMKDELD